ncbi:hypothetical protein TWF694_001686 [Orbilia ellipsospora]|uniref:PHD-type domain-containing protein n=1 Tax=Orbilia ellipsospora TaxID=2528407 RepID=A0AAV9X4I0_9PEZI
MAPVPSWQYQSPNRSALNTGSNIADAIVIADDDEDVISSAAPPPSQSQGVREKMPTITGNRAGPPAPAPKNEVVSLQSSHSQGSQPMIPKESHETNSQSPLRTSWEYQRAEPMEIPNDTLPDTATNSTISTTDKTASQQSEPIDIVNVLVNDSQPNNPTRDGELGSNVPNSQLPSQIAQSAKEGSTESQFQANNQSNIFEFVGSSGQPTRREFKPPQPSQHLDISDVEIKAETFYNGRRKIRCPGSGSGGSHIVFYGTKKVDGVVMYGCILGVNDIGCGHTATAAEYVNLVELYATGSKILNRRARVHAIGKSNITAKDIAHSKRTYGPTERTSWDRDSASQVSAINQGGANGEELALHEAPSIFRVFSRPSKTSSVVSQSSPASRQSTPTQSIERVRLGSVPVGSRSSRALDTPIGFSAQPQDLNSNSGGVESAELNCNREHSHGVNGVLARVPEANGQSKHSQHHLASTVHHYSPPPASQIQPSENLSATNPYDIYNSKVLHSSVLDVSSSAIATMPHIPLRPFSATTQIGGVCMKCGEEKGSIAGDKPVPCRKCGVRYHRGCSEALSNLPLGSSDWTCSKCKTKRRAEVKASGTSTPHSAGSRGHSAAADPPPVVSSVSSLKRKREDHDSSTNKRGHITRIPISSLTLNPNREPPTQVQLQCPSNQSTVKVPTQASLPHVDSPLEPEEQSRRTALSNSSKHNIIAPEPPQKKRRTHYPTLTHGGKPSTCEPPVKSSVETHIDSDCFIIEPVKDVNTSATTVTTAVAPEIQTTAITSKPPADAVESTKFTETQRQASMHLRSILQNEGTSLKLPHRRKTATPTIDTPAETAAIDRVSSAPPATIRRSTPRQPSPEIPFSRPPKSPEPDIVSSFSDVIEQYKKRCEAAEDKCHKLEKEAEKHKSLTEKLAAMTEKWQNSEKKAQEGLNQRVKLHNDMEELRKETNRLCDLERQGARRSKDEVMSLQARLEDRSREARENLRLRREESKAKQRLIEEVEAGRTVRASLEGQLSAAIATYGKLKGELVAARVGTGKLQEAYDREKALKEALEKALNQKMNSEVLKASLSSAAEIEKLQRDVVERDQIISRLDYQMRVETNKAENFKRDLRLREKDLSSELSKQSSLTNWSHDLRHKLGETEESYKAEKAKAASSLAQVESLKSLLEEKEKELERSKLETIELEARFLQSQDKNNQAEAPTALIVQLRQWQEKHTKAEESISKLWEKNKQAEETISRLEAQARRMENDYGSMVSDMNKACLESIRGSENSHRKKQTMEWLNQQMNRASYFMRWRCHQLEELCRREQLSLPEDGYKREKFVFFGQFLPDIDPDIHFESDGMNMEPLKLVGLDKVDLDEPALDQPCCDGAVSPTLGEPALRESASNVVTLAKLSLGKQNLPMLVGSGSNEIHADGLDVEMDLEPEPEPEPEPELEPQIDEPAFDFDSEFNVVDPFMPNPMPTDPVSINLYENENRTRSIRTSNDRGFKKPRWRRWLEKAQEINFRATSITGAVIVTNSDGSLCTEEDDGDELGGIKTRKRGRMSFEEFTGVELTKFVPITVGVSEKLAFKKFEKNLRTGGLSRSAVIYRVGRNVPGELRD